MSPSVSKDAIFDAAEAIVCESGAAHMTLDGVAERAQVSKGGLMYSFPTKAALLQGMIGRLIDNFEELRGKAREEFGESKPTPLMVEIKMLSQLDESHSRPSAALLAAIANQPDLMEPFQEEMHKRLDERILAGKNPDRSTILLLAAMGLHLTALLNLPLLDRAQRKKTYENLLRLAANDKKKL
jgi:AcrR family transcriptional regulator